jgi:hypothetical protein
MITEFPVKRPDFRYGELMPINIASRMLAIPGLTALRVSSSGLAELSSRQNATSSNTTQRIGRPRTERKLLVAIAMSQWLSSSKPAAVSRATIAFRGGMSAK